MLRLRKVPGVSRMFLVGAACSYGLLCSCMKSQVLEDTAYPAIDSPIQYSPLLEGAAPFIVDLDAPRPFGRHGIPWDDSRGLGVETVWLARPEANTALPEFALVINEYSSSRGMLCLVAEDGRVVGSTKGLGIIQRVRIVSIAPTKNPQILLYTNPCHGTGAAVGEFILLEFTEQAFRVLLRAPRYEHIALGWGELQVALPLLVRGVQTDPRIALPTITIRTPEDELVPGCVPECNWTYQEYKWDSTRRSFCQVESPSVTGILTEDAWKWMPDYYVGGVK
ncbi:MAG: hypothetical protein JXQ75_22530 [Phycisphaerae bacterium]|nr:hypothetical protein [Phycisphaerae bacterium]